MTTVAPCRARPVVIAFPRPALAPVTRKTPFLWIMRVPFFGSRVLTCYFLRVRVVSVSPKSSDFFNSLLDASTVTGKLINPRNANLPRHMTTSKQLFCIVSFCFLIKMKIKINKKRGWRSTQMLMLSRERTTHPVSDSNLPGLW